MSARETGDLPRCALCGSLNGIIDRQVMLLSITRGPGHRELWSVMACERCAVAIVEKNTEGGAPIRKDGGCGESPATFSPPSVPPPAPAQAGWTEVAAESIVKMLRPHDGESRHRLNVEEAQGSPMTPDPLEIARAVLRTERTRYVGQPERTDEVLAQALLAKDAEVRALREALDEIACWDEGPEVTGSFDEPGSAKIARAALAQEAGK